MGASAKDSTELDVACQIVSRRLRIGSINPRLNAWECSMQGYMEGRVDKRRTFAAVARGSSPQVISSSSNTDI
jgi:hypothetical protein